MKSLTADSSDEEKVHIKMDALSQVCTSCVARERLNPEEKSKRYLPRSVAFLTRISLCGNVSEEFHHQVPKEQDAVSSAA